MLDSLMSLSVVLPAASEVAASGGVGHFAAGFLALIAAINMMFNG